MPEYQTPHRPPPLKRQGPRLPWPVQEADGSVAAAAAAWRDTAAQVQAALDQATTAGAASAVAEPPGPHAEWQTQGLPLYNGHTETEYLFARTCCNALLIAYKLSRPVQCQRALALLTAITQCARGHHPHACMRHMHEPAHWKVFCFV